MVRWDGEFGYKCPTNQSVCVADGEVVAFVFTESNEACLIECKIDDEDISVISVIYSTKLNGDHIGK